MTSTKQPLPIQIGSKTGYCHIETAIGVKAVHRIVMEVWAPKDGMENLTVDHRNHNKRDNRVANLAWVTREENLYLAATDLYIENGQLVNENFGTPQIKFGSHLFKTFDEAIEYLLDKGKITNDNYIKSNVRNNIINSMMSNKKYCGKCWVLK